MSENGVVNELEVAEAHVAEEGKKTRKKAETPKGPPAPQAVAPHVYAAMRDVKAILAKSGGITKEREAKFGERYQFRGIDDMYNVLCGVTADAGLIMIPRVVGEPRIEREERASGKGFQTHVWLMVEVDFVSTHDGSKHTGCFLGEAIDTSDKASNKAMSAAFKYAHIMPFQIPTHGESDDTENHNHEVAAPAPVKPEFKVSAAQPVAPKPDSSNAAIDWQIALAQKIAVSDSFAALLVMAKDADPRAEPARGVVFQKIYTRCLELIQAATTMKGLQEAKGLIQALGSPAPLLACYNGRYSALRSVPAHTPES